MTEDEIRQNVSGLEMLTVSEVAHLLRVHPNSIRRWANQGTLKVYRIGNRGDRRFNADDVARFLESWEPSTGSSGTSQ